MRNTLFSGLWRSGRACQNVFKCRTGQRGATLAEVMVVIAILGLTMYFFASQMTANAKSASVLNRELAFVDVVGQIQQFSLNRFLCSTALAGHTLHTNDPLTITTGGLTLAAGTLFENGEVLITQLKWSKIDPVSATEAVGYISVQGDLNGSNGFFGGGANIRNFPAPGSVPPGIMVNLQLDGITGAVTGCGPQQADSGTQRVSFPVNIISNSDNQDFSGSVTLPSAYADTNYSIICSAVNPWIGSHNGGKNLGVVAVTGKTASNFSWHYWQYIGDYNPPITVNIDCVIGHY